MSTTDEPDESGCLACVTCGAPASEPAAPVDARDALTANRDAWMAQAQALAQAAGQASFCLRTLVSDDPDAQMTVRMLDAALAAPSTAAIREDEHAVFEEDGDDGKWRISASGATRKAEPAAPVDARDANARRYEWLRERVEVRQMAAVSGTVRPAIEVRIGRAFLDSRTPKSYPPEADIERSAKLDAAIDAALARQAAAPAEGEK